MTNHEDKICHMFDSVENQLSASRGCLLCQCDCNESSVAAVSVLVVGSPCDPFSVLRNKRFVDGNVKSHASFETTFTHVVQLVKKYHPYVAIFEQVMGFDMPFTSGSKETPYQRPAVRS